MYKENHNVSMKYYLSATLVQTMFACPTCFSLDVRTYNLFQWVQ